MTNPGARASRLLDNWRLPLSAFYLLFAILLYTPLLILHLHHLIAPFRYADLAVAGAICLTALPAFRIIGRGRWVRPLQIVIGAAALYVLVSVSLYPFNSGPLDGRQLHMGQSDSVGHLCLALACVGIFAWYRDPASRILHALGLGSVLVSAYLVLNLPLEQRDPEAIARIPRMGRTNNILMIEMDMFQGYFVRRYLDGHQDLARRFEGFTLFENAVSAGPYTTMSVRHILTGTAPVKSTGAGDSIRAGDNILSDALSHGYTPTYGYITAPVRLPGLNSQDASMDLDRGSRYFALARESARRYLPLTSSLGARPLEFGWISKTDARDSLIWLIDSLYADPTTEKSFLYYHSVMTHQPIRFDSAGAYDKSLSPDDLYGELGYALGLLAKLVDRLKALGLYDETTVIILGDHGYNFLDSLTERTLPRDASYLREPLGKNNVGQFDVALMVKPRGSDGALRHSTAAVVLTDLRKTLLEIMNPGSGENRPGVNILGEQLPEERDVVVLTFVGEKFTNKDFLRLDSWEPAPLHLPLRSRQAGQAR